MLALIKNEIIKMVKRPKTWVLVGLLLLAATGLTLIAYGEWQNNLKWDRPEYKIENANREIDFSNSMIADYKKEIATLEGTLKNIKGEKQIAEMKQNIENYKEMLLSEENALKETKESIKKYEKEIKNPTPWQEKLKGRIEQLKAELENTKKEAELQKVETTRKDEQQNLIKRMEDDIALYEYYLKNNIEPVEYGRFTPAKTLLVFSALLSMAIPFFIAVFVSDIVSDEATNETFKFLLIQPVSRGKILLSKFITITTFVSGLILAVQGIIFALCGFINGFNDLSQYTLIGARYEVNKELLLKEGIRELSIIPNSQYWVSNGELLTKYLALQLLFVICCCAFVFMISTIFKSNMISMAVSTTVVITFVFGPMVVQPIGKIMNFVFLGYSNIEYLLLGHLAEQFQNVNITLGNGILVMIVTTIVAYGIAHVNFKRKEILA